MTFITPDHQAKLQDGRLWHIAQFGELVLNLTKAEILPHFKSLLKSDGERTASGLLNNAYATRPMKLTQAECLIKAILAAREAKGLPALAKDPALEPAFFFIDDLAAIFKESGLDALTFPKAHQITTELLQDLENGARTTLFTALLVMRELNRLRHSKGLGWIDPRKVVLTEVYRDKKKLKVVAATDTQAETTSYAEWNPAKGKPTDLHQEDRAAKGQDVAEWPPKPAAAPNISPFLKLAQPPEQAESAE